MSASKDTSKERRFWRALATDVTAATETSDITAANKTSDVTPSADTKDLTLDLDDLDADEREVRLQTLKSMLAANEARQRDALRKRRPSMAIGELVAVTTGELAGNSGVVLDADFIHGRVQLELDGMPEPQWVSFRRIGAVASKEAYRE